MKPAAPLELELLLAESGWVRGLARKLVQDEHAAEDVEQDVLQTAWADRPALEGPKLRAWLATVTRRFAKKRQAREAQRRVVENEASRAMNVSSDSSERLALHRLLVDALDSLPPLQREVVLLRFFDDLPPRKIAQRLGLPSATVRQRLSRALRKLREHLDHQADPESSADGRALWCAAFTQHLVPSGVPLSAPLLSAVSITVMTKFLLPVAALLVLLGLFWKQQSTEAPHPAIGQVEVSNSQLLTEPPQEAMTSAETQVPRQSLARGESHSTRQNSVTLRVRSEENSGLKSPLAFLQSSTGSVVPVELDEGGVGTFSRQENSVRLYAGAQDHKPGWLEVAQADDSVELELEALIDLHGRWIEDGGVPPYEVRWTAQIRHEDFGAAPRIRRALALGPVERDVHTGAGGHFTLAGVRRGAELRVELPWSHAFEEPFAATEPHSESSTPERFFLISEASIELRTMRKPSIVARVVRADNGRPVRNASFMVRSINVFGKTSGESDENTDENGIASNPIWIDGVVEDHWAVMSPGERRSSADRYPRIRYEIVPVQADLLPVTAVVDAPATGYCYDLGTIALPVLAVREVRVVDASGRGLPGAVVQVGELAAVHTDDGGIARVPALELAEHGCRALASGYGLGTLEASLIPPQKASANPPKLVLRPGPEVHLTLPKGMAEATDLRLEYSWERTPFENLPSTEFPYEYALLEALLGYDAMFHLFHTDPQNLLAAATAFARFDSSGTARLPSLQPGAVLFVAVCEPNRFAHSKQRIEVPMTSGIHRIELKYDPADLQTAPAWTLRGTVRDDVGRPIRAARLDWRHGGHYGTRGTEFTDEDGAFEFPAFLFTEKSGAQLQLTIEKEGLYPEQFSWGEEPSDPLEIVLARSRRVEISVRDGDGRLLMTSPPPYDGRLDTPDAELLGVGHMLYPRFPYDAQEFVFVVGLKSYTRELPEGLESFEFELPAHGHLVAEFLDPPDDLRLTGTLRTAEGSDRNSFPLRINAWGPRRSFDLLPGTYEIELEGKQPRLIEIRPGETLRIDLGAY